MVAGRSPGRPVKPVREPRQRRARATVAAIVDAAARMPGKRGGSGFNPNAIAARAGVSVGSLYESFPDEQALLDRVLRGHLADAEALTAELERMLGGYPGWYLGALALARPPGLR